MAVQRLIGVVQDDGSILIKDALGFQPGMTVELEVRQFEIPQSVSIEEAKQILAEWDERELTPEQIDAWEQVNAMFDAIASDNLGLPEDHVDEMDHYLYGTPKRGSSQQAGS